MRHSSLNPLGRSVPTAQRWISDIAAELGTDDLDLAYRICKAWLHTVRDRLPVVDAAHLGAQLPELLRGSYYDGWLPGHVPVRYDARSFALRFAHLAGIAVDDADDAAHAVSQVLDRHMSGHLRTVMDHLPTDLRSMLQPRPPAALHELVDG